MKFNKLVSADPPFPHRISIGVWGTGCRALRSFVGEASNALGSHLSLAFLDASHEEEHSEAFAKMRYFKSRDFIEIYGKGINKEGYLWQQHELLVINAHHHSAGVNCLIIDGQKPYKSLPELEAKTQYVWLKNGTEAFVNELKGGNFPGQGLRCFYEQNGQTLSDIFTHHASQQEAPLHALILTGGKSTRMGSDKSEIRYHGKAQREFLASTMQELKIPYSISCNHEQYEAWGAQSDLLPDRFHGFGPMSGILSAFCEFPGKALLVIACDLPYLDKAAIQHLVGSRSCLHKVSAYRDSEKAFADPLAAIWEPETYPLLLQFLALGKTCPRRALEHLSLFEVTPPHPRVLLNANTPEERDFVQHSASHEHQG